MNSLINWISVPSHYTPILLAAYSVLEYVLGKSNAIKPNSALDLILHLATGKIGEVLAKNDAKPPVEPPAAN